MLFHCQALSPDRWNDQRFLKIYNHFQAVDLSRDEAWELAVCLATGGFTRGNWRSLFNWTSITMRQVVIVEEYFKGVESVQEAAAENTRSIGLSDGIDWLKAVLEVNPRFRGVVPMWTQLALQGLTEEDFNKTEVALAIGVPGVGQTDVKRHLEAFAKWRDQVVWDFASGEQLR